MAYAPQEIDDHESLILGSPVDFQLGIFPTEKGFQQDARGMR